jgi:3',5'-cyclic-AMP phosphodiesterase
MNDKIKLHKTYSLQQQHNVEQLRILQVSDCHLYASNKGQLLGINTRTTFDTVIQDALNEHSHNPFDLIIVTGDLSQDYTKESYHVLCQIMTKFDCPWFWIPGNHDENKLIQSEVTGGNAHDHKHIISKDWQVILLDSSVDKTVHGILSESELQFCEACLLANPDKSTMVVTHHQPVNVGSKWLDNIGILNSSAYWDIAKKYPQLKCMLWGHVHQEFDQTQSHVRLLATPSTCVQFKPKSQDFAAGDELPGYRVIQLLNDGEINSSVTRCHVDGFKVDYSINGY